MTTEVKVTKNYVTDTVSLVYDTDNEYYTLNTGDGETYIYPDYLPELKVIMDKWSEDQ